MLGFSSDGYDQWAEDSVLVYDYYLEIDKSKITDESIRKYGVEITADGYRFIAKKEAVVNNTIPFIYNYILINGQKGKTYFSVNFNDEAVTVPDKFWKISLHRSMLRLLPIKPDGMDGARHLT